MNRQGDLVFTLDIGTRTVIGLVIENTGSIFKILASQVVEHEQRSMLDGQIHNVNEVARQVKKVKDGLEKELNLKLERVAVAAAGRALKTVNYEKVLEFENKRIITPEDVRRLEFTAVQEAQSELAAAGENAPGDYHFVGYSVVEYLLDGIFIGNLEGQRGKKLQAKIVATFLPRIVIDSLLSVINRAELEVEYLTLEPIAAANVVIPRDMYSFNLALIDIGAGTSDIALTRGGAMIGYAMVPVAGDEITEALAEHFLLDYQTGERIKRSLSEEGQKEYRVRNILSQEVIITREEALKVIKPVVQDLAAQISEAILSLNKKSPQAVICVGGGSLTPALLTELANFLEIDPARVGIKDSKDINSVSGTIKGINSAQAITPLGIALTSYQNKNKVNFVEVEVNRRTIQLFTLNKPSIADALLAAEIDLKKLRGRTGRGLTCNVNGELKVLKGTMGKPGKVFLNGKEAGLDSLLSPGDSILFMPGEDGQNAAGTIADVVPELKSYTIKINGERVELKPSIYQNGKLVDLETPLIDGADIKYSRLKTIRDGIASLYEIAPEELGNQVLTFTLNGEKHYLTEGDFLILEEGEVVDLNRPLTDNLNLEIKRSSKAPFTVEKLPYKDEIFITFNGNELTIPVKIEIFSNGEKVDKSYLVKEGDEIILKPRPVSINYILKYINYKVSPVIDNLAITINGQPAGLEDTVEDGDKLEIGFH